MKRPKETAAPLTDFVCPSCRRPEGARVGKSLIARCACCTRNFHLIGADRRRAIEADQKEKNQ